MDNVCNVSRNMLVIFDEVHSFDWFAAIRLAFNAPAVWLTSSLCTHTQTHNPMKTLSQPFTLFTWQRCHVT